MSEENKSGSAAPEKESDPVEEKNQVVSKKAYEEVTRDMHKNKQKAKELEMTVNELRAQFKAQEEAKMQEQEQWKELYQKREAELEQERQRAKQEHDRYTRSIKISALKGELGGNIKDDYLVHARVEDITFTEDGKIDADSLHSVANQFRNEHGQLIPTSENVNITGHGPSSEPVSNDAVDLSKLSPGQLVEYYSNHKNNQQ